MTVIERSVLLPMRQLLADDPTVTGADVLGALEKLIDMHREGRLDGENCRKCGHLMNEIGIGQGAQLTHIDPTDGEIMGVGCRTASFNRSFKKDPESADWDKSMHKTWKAAWPPE